MREDLTEICMVIDRSGSMASLTDDTIGGINAFIRSQKEAPGDAILTTIFFSNTCDVVHDGICLESVPDVTRMDYIPMGCTALLDAVGEGIQRIKTRMSYVPERYRPAHVLFAIMTDGQENASQKYNLAKIKNMISEQTEKGWKFIYMGAHPDAFDDAYTLGIDKNMTMQYTHNSIGTDAAFTTMSCASTSLRSTGDLTGLNTKTCSTSTDVTGLNTKVSADTNN